MSMMFCKIERPGRKPRWRGWASFANSGSQQHLAAAGMIRVSVLLMSKGRSFAWEKAEAPVGDIMEGVLGRQARIEPLKAYALSSYA